MSKREEAKAERRRRIIAAARALVRETGDAGLSMRALAARAGVAITTPYSLFGSKNAIVIALLDDVRRFQESFASLGPADAIERIFQAVSISLGYLADDPALYRTLWSEVLRSENLALRSELASPERYAFWHDLIAAARAEGALLPAIAIDPLLRHLDAIYVAALAGWVLGDIPLEQVEARAGYGYALALRGAATADAARGLEARIARHQGVLTASTSEVGAPPANG